MSATGLPFKLCGVALGVIAATGAHAYSGVRTEYAALNSLVNASKVTASEAISNASASAKAVGRVDLIGPGGRAVAGDLTVTMARRAVILEAATLMSRVALPLAVAVTAYQLWDKYRAKPAGDNENWSLDAGQPSQTTNGWCGTLTGYGAAVNVCGSTAQGAADAALGVVMARSPGCPSGYSGFAASHAAVTGSYPNFGAQVWVYPCHPSGQTTNLPGPSVVASVGLGETSYQECPGYGTSGQPGFVARGGSPGYDAKCPTGEYSQAATPAQLAALAEQYAGNGAGTVDTGALLREILNAGPVSIPADAAMELDVATVQPQTLTGATVTTTNPDGSSTETQTSYAPAQALAGTGSYGLTQPWRERITTTTKSPTGTTTGTTTTTTMPGSGTTVGTTTGTGATGTTSASDPCVATAGNAAASSAVVIPASGATSTRVGCMELGTAPTDAVPKRVITLAWATELISLPSGCPPDVPLWGGRVFAMAPACDGLVSLRPVLLAGTAFTCLIFAIKALRG